MDYPTIEEVKHADRHQLGEWYRHLPSPGMAHIALSSQDEFMEKMQAEAAVMRLISERFHQSGGWDADLSKAVGWEPR